MDQANWLRLRSDIYIRDKGICWICNTFTELHDYDLGHLIDRCNGGHDDYDNLAVMHKPCNLSKPRHLTLEEAVRWKLTTYFPAKAVLRNIGHLTNKQLNIQPLHEPNKRGRPRNDATPKALKHLNDDHVLDVSNLIAPLEPLEIEKRHKAQNPHIVNSRQMIYEEQIKKIVPGTVCWVQGRPHGGPMWKVLPPPYKQEDIFSMRRTPPGATDDDKGEVIDTFQVIGGKLTQDKIEISLGHSNFIIEQDIRGNLSIEYKPTNNSNIGDRCLTVGNGIGQIPISEWKAAKARGISLSDFRAQYMKRAPDYSI